MKILIIHGWGNSAEIYKKLANDLNKNLNTDCYLYELAGFGSTPAKYFKNIIPQYVNELKTYVKNNDIDIIIAHSLGGNISLKCIKEVKLRKLILLSPLYCGIDILKIVKYFKNFAISLLNLLHKKNQFTDMILKAFSLIAINNGSKISNQVIDDIRRFDNRVAVELLIEMSNEDWRIQEPIDSEVVLVVGENDRVIKKNKMKILIKDMPSIKTYQISNIGHTAVLENYDELLQIINREI